MLGNNEHFYPGQDDKDGEDEEEEEEQGGENREEEGGRDTENGGLESLEEKEMTGGRQSWEGKAGEVVKPAAIVVGRQRADRPPRPGNLANRGITYMTSQAPLHHQLANKQLHHLIAGNQQPHHLNALQKRRALMERSMTTVAPLEDTFLTMMVFRIGIPDIKQTVGACSHPKTCHETKTPAHETIPGSTWPLVWNWFEYTEGEIQQFRKVKADKWICSTQVSSLYLK